MKINGLKKHAPHPCGSNSSYLYPTVSSSVCLWVYGSVGLSLGLFRGSVGLSHARSACQNAQRLEERSYASLFIKRRLRSRIPIFLEKSYLDVLTLRFLTDEPLRRYQEFQSLSGQTPLRGLLFLLVLIVYLLLVYLTLLQHYGRNMHIRGK